MVRPSCGWDALALLLACACAGAAPSAPPSNDHRAATTATEKIFEREEAHVRSTYVDLPAPSALPPFLTLDAVARALPAEWKEMRAWIEPQLAGKVADPAMQGAYLDAEERYYLVWLSRNSEQLALIFDRRARKTHQQFFSRGRPTLKDVIALETPQERERGLTTRELIVFRITSMSLCCLPSDVEVYALERGGGLRSILSFPQKHVDIGPGFIYHFLNHVEFLDRRVVVTQLLPNTSLRWNFEYRDEQGRFEPDAATAESLAAERVRWQNH